MERLCRLDSGVVELNPLTDPDRTGPNDDGPRSPEREGFVFLLVRGIKIGGRCGELSGAGVDHLVDRKHGYGLTGTAHVMLRATGEPGDGVVAESRALCGPQELGTEFLSFQTLFDLNDALQIVQEPAIYATERVEVVDASAS